MVPTTAGFQCISRVSLASDDGRPREGRGAGGLAPGAPSARRTRPCRSIALRGRWWRLARRLRPDLGADRLQGSDAVGQEVAVPVNDAV
jgi:hypothetical protein